MSAIHTWFTSHLFSGVLALVVVVGIAGIFLPQPSTARASATVPATASGTHVPVLLLHGLEGYNTANCLSDGNSSLTFVRWDGFYQINSTDFAGISFDPSLIHPLKYFIGDTNCGPGFPGDNNNGDIGDDSHCDNYYNTRILETNDEDIRHIACRFYWFVYTNYTKNGIPVNILAHSMGGIIVKWALSEAAQHNSTVFPFPLLVYNVVTLSTPFQGIPTNFLDFFYHTAAGIACGQCFDALQLENGGANSIISQLNAFPSTQGYWTVIGASGDVPPGTQLLSLWIALVSVTFPTCDFVNVGSDLSVDHSVTTPGPSLASAQVIDYDQCIFHEEDYHGAYASFPGTDWPISTSYQDDTSTFKDYSGWVGTPGNESYTFRTLPHPLAKALEALGVTRGPDSYPPAPYPVYDVPGGGAFFTVWMQVSGPAGVLGEPTDSWYSVSGGQAQDFQGGSIYWSSATNSHEVQGAIYAEYNTTMHGPGGALGFPVTDEQAIAGGHVSYFIGQMCNGGGPNDSGSAIYDTPGTGAHEVHGCIYHEYILVGGPGGTLGFPATDEQAIAGGHVEYFRGGGCGLTNGSAIYDTPGTGAHEVQGCILSKYESLSGPNSVLGFPVTDEQAIATGRVSYFYGNLCGSRGPNNSGSAIYYSSATGTHQIGGCIYNKYWHMNGPNSMLGFPTSDVEVIAGGYESLFSGTTCGTSGSGSILMYSSSSGQTHEIHGCIYQHYLYAVRKGVSLGLPTSDEQNVYNSSGQVIGRENTFAGAGCNGTGSAILDSAGTGAHEVHGCIYHAYVNFGGPASGLGLPTSDEYTNSSGQRESDFQNGYIIWWNGQAFIFVNNPGCGPVSASC